MNAKNETNVLYGNFWTPKTVMAFILVSILLIALSLDVFIVSLDTLKETFQVSQFRVSLVLGLWSAGVCIGQFVFGPLMDAVGRRKVFLFGMVLTSASSFICLVTEYFDVILVMRLLHGLGLSTQILVSRAVIIDLMHDPHRRAQVFSLNIFFTLLGAVSAPLFASFMLTTFGWESLFLTLAIASSVVAFFLVAGFPETLPRENRSKLQLGKQLQGYFSLLKSPVFLGYSCVGAIAFCWIFAQFVGSAYVFENVFHFGTKQFSIFLTVNMGFGIAMSLLNTYLLKRYRSDTLLRVGETIFCTHTLIFLVMTLMGFPSPYAYMAVIFFGNCSITLLTSNSMTGAVSHDPIRSGTASALYGLLQFGAGSFASAFLGYGIDLFISIGRAQSILPIAIFFSCLGASIILCRFTLLRNKC